MVIFKRTCGRASREGTCMRHGAKIQSGSPHPTKIIPSKAWLQVFVARMGIPVWDVAASKANPNPHLALSNSSRN